MLKIHNRDRFERIKLNEPHHSIEFENKKMLIKLKVKRNKELENFIMEHSDQIEVLEPASLRKQIIKKIKKALKTYKTN